MVIMALTAEEGAVPPCQVALVLQLPLFMAVKPEAVAPKVIMEAVVLKFKETGFTVKECMPPVTTVLVEEVAVVQLAVVVPVNRFNWASVLPFNSPVGS